MFLQYAPQLLIARLAGDHDAGTASSLRGAVVLFADIADSTALTDEFARLGGEGAERLASLLNRYFGRVIAIVAAHGGDIVKIDGDAVVAVWPVSDDDADARRRALAAAAAALALLEQLRDRPPIDGVTLRHRITLVTGPVRSIVVSEASGRKHFVVDGPAIRRLGDPRLRGEPDQAVADADIAALLDGTARFAPMGPGSFELLGLVDGVVAPRRDRVAPAPRDPEDTALDAGLRPFVPKVIADRIAVGQAEWIAEFRTLTVVYVNLSGTDPSAPDFAARVEAAVRGIERVVDPLHIPITNVVANEKGLTVQIACGLPPFAQEHAAMLAVRAALRIRADLAAIGTATAIGITTGEAFCGDVGNDVRREYTCTGLVMAYAARLMQSAANEILCDETTAREAAGSASFSDAERIRVKGRAEPMPVRRVRDAGRARSRLLTSVGVMHGRQAELQLLSGRLAGVAAGRGGIAAIEAEPGAGKSHLLAQVAETARAAGCFVLVAATSLVEQTTAYFVWRELLPQLARAPDEAAEVAVADLGARMTELLRDQPLATRVALLEDILPLGLANKGLAPEIRGQARLTGIEEVLAHIAAARAARSPVVIVVDDLQWIDASSARVLTTLARRVPRLLVVAAARPRDAATSAHVRALLAAATPVVSLPRLSRDAIQAIVRDRLRLPAVPAVLVDFIQERSEGLPFFAEQLLFALRDHGAVTVDADACRVAVANLADVGAPNSLRELIVSRVDRLPPSRQLAIKVASAVGRVFDAETLREVHPLSADAGALDETLDQLVAAGFLSRSRESARTIYAFRHGIIQGVTYDLLPYGQRRPLHRRIALALEARHAGALAPHYATLAEHWERAAEAGHAIAYRIDAADIASQRYANEDALNHLERARRLVAEFTVGLPDAVWARCARIEADACQELTRFAEADRHYRTLAALEGIPVPRTKTQRMLGIAAESVQQVLRRTGLVRSLSQGRERVRDSVAAHIHMRFAEYAYFTNDTLGLAHGTLASLNRAERAAALPEIVNASGGLALGLAAVGLLAWANYYRDRSIALAITAGSPSAQGFAELLACVQSFHIGDWERMGAHGSRGAAIWKELGDRYRHQCCLVLEVYRMLATGQYERADRALLQFGEDAEEIESLQVRAWALAANALLDLMLGRPPARAVARIATATAGGDLNPAERLLCDGIAAAAHLAAGDPWRALKSAESGLQNIAGGSPAMAGALLFSVPCIAEVLLVLADRAREVGRTRDELLDMSTTACRAAQRFAARNRICRPRASLLRGHLAAASGRTRGQEVCYREALLDAERLGLPLEQAMSHLALARVPGAAADRDRHRMQAGAILRRLGVAGPPWQRASQ